MASKEKSAGADFSAERLNETTEWFEQALEDAIESAAVHTPANMLLGTARALYEQAGVDEIGGLLGQLVTLVPFEIGEIPAIDESTEPIGFAVEVDDHAIEGALVLPASALAVMYDQAKGVLADRILGLPAAADDAP